MEPRAATPGRRLETMRALADAGIPVGVMTARSSGAEDNEMEAILAAAVEAGATQAGYTLLRLHWRSRICSRVARSACPRSGQST